VRNLPLWRADDDDITTMRTCMCVCLCVCIVYTLYNILVTTVLITGSGLKGWEGWRSAISTRAGSKIPMIVARWTRTPFHCRSVADDKVWPKGVCRSSAWSLRIYWRRDGPAVIAPLLLYYYTATVLNSHYPITVIAVFVHCAPSATDCNTTGRSRVGAKTIETHVCTEGVGHREQGGRRTADRKNWVYYDCWCHINDRRAPPRTSVSAASLLTPPPYPEC